MTRSVALVLRGNEQPNQVALLVCTTTAESCGGCAKLGSLHLNDQVGCISVTRERAAKPGGVIGMHHHRGELRTAVEVSRVQPEGIFQQVGLAIAVGVSAVRRNARIAGGAEEQRATPPHCRNITAG